MALDTFSLFFYGLKIDNTNNKIDFNEGGGDLVATIPSGTYSFDDLFVAIETQMNAVGSNVYDWSVDRTNRIVTASADNNFDLLIQSGVSSSVTPWGLLGFTLSVDLTGADNYDGDSAAAEAYQPQFVLQDYTPPENFQDRRDPSVNESASGIVEVISFGTVQFINMSFKFITNKPGDCVNILNNATGVEDARAFFTSITERGVFEFMPDHGDRNTYYKVIVESFPGSRTGTGFRLVELVGQSLPDYYEINNVKLRVSE